MKKLNNMRSAFIFLVFALASSSGYAMGMQNNVNSMETVVLTSVIKSDTNPSFGNADLVRVAGASNLFWVFGGSLVGLSLVMRRLSV